MELNERLAVMESMMKEIHKAIMGNGEPGLVQWRAVMTERLKDYEKLEKGFTGAGVVYNIVLWFFTPSMALAVLVFVLRSFKVI